MRHVQGVPRIFSDDTPLATDHAHYHLNADGAMPRTAIASNAPQCCWSNGSQQRRMLCTKHCVMCLMLVLLAIGKQH